jgi:hypothetical protein
MMLPPFQLTSIGGQKYDLSTIQRVLGFGSVHPKMRVTALSSITSLYFFLNVSSDGAVVGYCWI